MKKIFTFLFVLATFVSAFAQQTAQKTLIKTFSLNGNDVVVLNLDGVVQVEEWANPTLRLHIDITLENAGVNMLKHLITQGRYNLDMEGTPEGVKILSPGRNQEVVISKDGEKLKELVVYTVFVPANVKILKEGTDVPTTETASTGDK